MAISSFPFDNQTTSEDQYTKLFRQFADSGVIGSYGSDALQVTANGGGMKVSVNPGLAIVRGHMFWSDSLLSLNIEAASTSARIDVVVLHLDPDADAITPLVVKGDPLLGTAPALIKTDVDVYEIPLAYITVPANATNIAAGQVQDARRYSSTHVGSWGTATRPSSPTTGQFGYNNDSKSWEFFDGGWKNLVQSMSWSDVTGKPATFPPATHVHDWADIANKPTSFTPSAHAHDWTEITNKPTSFPPAAHTHSEYAPAAGSWGFGYVSLTSAVNMGLSYSAGFPIISVLGTNYQVVTIPRGDDRYAPISHSHPTPGTVSRANGSDRPHAYGPGGSGEYYAVWVDANHNFCRNTSSRRYKENIRDHDVDPAAVLALQPRIYDRKPKDGETGNKDEYGLIAEEVHETLPEIVTFYDGEIDSIRYDLLAVALLNVVKDQERRIAALEALVS